MNRKTVNFSPLFQARIAGFLALLILVTGTFAGFVHTNLVVGNNAAATAQNIMASETIFRLGILSSLAMYTLFIFYVLVLYRLLKPVNRNLALLMTVLAMTGVPIALLNQANQFAVLLLLDSSGYLTPLASEQVNALILFFLKLHGYGNLVGVIFWGLWLFPLGWLVFRSSYFPDTLGSLLMIGCFGWLVVVFQRILLPDYEWLSYSRYAAHIAELFWMLWLLIRGLNLDEWNNYAADNA